METTAPVQTAAQPKTLMEAVRYFADADRTLAMAVQLRWPGGVHCPTCGRTDVRFLATRRLWECKEKHPRKQFSVKVGTIFEDSPLPLDKWFVAIWSIANCKNGISSYELARATGVTQKSAWFMLHRIRLAMAAGSFDKMGGIVESDESYIGGLAKNMHAHKREARISRSAANAKTAVMGILERGNGVVASRVRARTIKDANAKVLQAAIRANVEPGSQLMTDSLLSYRGLGREYVHQYVNHAVEYVRGNIHTNGVENFWSLLKRSIKGTYVSVDPLHLDRYLGEQTFRFNERKDNDLGRFRNVLGSVAGKRLTYKDLTNHALSPAAA
jgi:transposase-like protein